MSKFSLLALVFSILALAACQQDAGVISGETKSGYPYKMYIDEPGPIAQIGDKVRFFEQIFINDSLVYTNEYSVVLPEETQVASPPPANYELLLLLSEGDSASVHVYGDQLASIPGLTLDPATDSISYHIAFREVEQAKADRESAMLNIKAKEQTVKERTETTINGYLEGELDNIIQTSATGLKYIIHEQGEGNQPEAGSTIAVHYYGMLRDKTMFDNSYQRGEPFEFQVGRGQVIKGWDEGLQLLNEGGSATLFIPYDLAYGEAGRPPTIPPKSELVFFVELLEIK